MNSSSVDLDRFVHTLISPLTALQGAVGLLRRSREDEQRSLLLLATIERNIERLRLACDQILNHAQIVDNHVHIELPTLMIGSPHSPPHPVQPATPQRNPVSSRYNGPLVNPNLITQEQNLLLIVAPTSLSANLIMELEVRGHHLIWARDTSEGIDLARHMRPGIIILDPHLDAQASLVGQILNEDPETKMIPLILLHDAPQKPNSDDSWLLEQIEACLHLSCNQHRSLPHILIVEDEPDIAYLIAAQFAGEGYMTTVVSSGAEALRVVRKQQFDLILLDLLLPDIDGFTVLGGLRVQPETQLTPIILLSAINSPADKVRGLQLGADDYITKPFSDVELNARVQAAMRRSEREGGANPSTRLPGNIAIERAISQRIEQRDVPFAVCYCDLDNFKAYNDTYGFLKGDAVIQRTAQILLDAVREFGNPDDFVGHIGGDDFVIITSLDRLETIGQNAITRFDTTAPLFYDREARQRGYISGHDRQGQPTIYPLVSISIIAVSSRLRHPSHPGEVAQRSVEPKKRAKHMPGSVFIVEE
ncbi:response regulator receiver modulated diguanylate cyclase [Oscillochloris trichoides DG-6]|uniref:Response regulator receiver modulated diguanylate cyclase n=1 Tax=Oscillochloris trichoides DG-6 TaxID=765420 RepID=E1ICR5_9CHLR|nr:response regulator [Oscillochloris trichoides]EFO81013.1 response regulator receiver modulated diguanylate cyclase [Oscillochloris trichoides DG-6]